MAVHLMQSKKQKSLQFYLLSPIPCPLASSSPPPCSLCLSSMISLLSSNAPTNSGLKALPRLFFHVNVLDRPMAKSTTFNSFPYFSVSSILAILAN